MCCRASYNHSGQACTALSGAQMTTLRTQEESLKNHNHYQLAISRIISPARFLSTKMLQFGITKHGDALRYGGQILQQEGMHESRQNWFPDSFHKTNTRRIELTARKC